MKDEATQAREKFLEDAQKMKAIFVIILQTVLTWVPIIILYHAPNVWWGIAIKVLSAMILSALFYINIYGIGRHLCRVEGIGFIINALLFAIIYGVWPPLWIRIPLECVMFLIWYTCYTILTKKDTNYIKWQSSL